MVNNVLDVRKNVARILGINVSDIRTVTVDIHKNAYTGKVTTDTKTYRYFMPAHA